MYIINNVYGLRPYIKGRPLSVGARTATILEPSTACSSNLHYLYYHRRGPHTRRGGICYKYFSVVIRKIPSGDITCTRSTIRLSSIYQRPCAPSLDIIAHVGWLVQRRAKYIYIYFPTKDSLLTPPCPVSHIFLSHRLICCSLQLLETDPAERLTAHDGCESECGMRVGIGTC